MTEFHADAGLRWAVFDPGQLGVIAWQTGDGNTAPHTAEDALESSPSVEVVLDGPMFSSCGRGCLSSDYLLFDARRSVQISGRYPTRGGTIAVVPTADARGRAVTSQGAQMPADAIAAVQGYPTIVWNGANIALPTLNTERVGRAALALLADGRLALVIGTGTMHDFADRVRALGATHAVYTDGGHSTALAIRGDRRYGAAESPAVAAWLGVWPAPSAPWWATKGGASETPKRLLALGILGASGAGLYYWIRKRSKVMARPRKP